MEIPLAHRFLFRPERQHLYRLIQQAHDLLETGVHVHAGTLHVIDALLDANRLRQEDDGTVLSHHLEIVERLHGFHLRRPQLLLLLLHVQRVADVLEESVAIADRGVIRFVRPRVIDRVQHLLQTVANFEPVDRADHTSHIPMDIIPHQFVRPGVGDIPGQRGQTGNIAVTRCHPTIHLRALLKNRFY